MGKISGREKTTNINIPAGLSRNWAGIKKMFMCFVGPISCVEAEQTHKQNRGQSWEMLFVCAVVVQYRDMPSPVLKICITRQVNNGSTEKCFGGGFISTHLPDFPVTGKYLRNQFGNTCGRSGNL